ncbi:hypothetical protein HK101_006311 [Irineochytrium annulatum]|nr:hypothetical protein HK101_006311 [Irineochytrium annulatum]
MRRPEVLPICCGVILVVSECLSRGWGAVGVADAALILAEYDAEEASVIVAGPDEVERMRSDEANAREKVMPSDRGPWRRQDEGGDAGSVLIILIRASAAAVPSSIVAAVQDPGFADEQVQTVLVVLTGAVCFLPLRTDAMVLFCAGDGIVLVVAFGIDADEVGLMC